MMRGVGGVMIMIRRPPIIDIPRSIKRHIALWVAFGDPAALARLRLLAPFFVFQVDPLASAFAAAHGRDADARVLAVVHLFAPLVDADTRQDFLERAACQHIHMPRCVIALVRTYATPWPPNTLLDLFQSPQLAYPRLRLMLVGALREHTEGLAVAGARDLWGRTPLHVYCQLARDPRCPLDVAIVRGLLRLGVDASAVSDDGETAFTIVRAMHAPHQLAQISAICSLLRPHPQGP